MKIAVAQINPTVGDITGNMHQIIDAINRAKKKPVDLVIFPELSIIGYPPKDLLLKKSFIHRNKEALTEIIDSSQNISVIVGFVDESQGNLYNAAAFINNGKLLEVHHKMHLPNYDVFDEKRYFQPGKKATVVELQGKKIGINVCEDIWMDDGPARAQQEAGAELIINISASPFQAGKWKIREELLSRRAREHQVAILYANTVGGQDDLIFDGRSYLFNPQGTLLAQGKSFQEDFMLLPEYTDTKASGILNSEEEAEEIYSALILGIKDYVHKNGFSTVVIGLSGGIDSALTAALAVQALGKDQVVGVSMPSTFSSAGSIADAQQLAQNLGIRLEIIPIKEMYKTYLQDLSPQFKGTAFNVAEENLQARIRGNILMALSNKFGYLVLATGNKSELSVGYATLYGDMCGGLAVISDVLKTKVYQVATYFNQQAGYACIPEASLVKEPSAELRENQKDSDSLPPYEILDPILQAYVENDRSKEEIIAMGFDKNIVSKVIKMVDRNEYKRQQAAVGIRITLRAFGSGRRMPITNGWGE